MWLQKILLAILDTVIPPRMSIQWEKIVVTPPPHVHEPVFVESKPVPEVLSFDTPKLAWHATRVMCDRAGLSLTQKNIVCACIWQESNFYNRYSTGKPVMHVNMQNGHETSTDWGIVQVNDFWWIGDTKLFPSVQYVLDHPEKAVQWMIDYMKKNQHLNRWSSYSTGAYKQWLPLTSAMWKLTG